MSKIPFVIVLTLLCANAKSNEDDNHVISRSEEVKSTFGRLLNSIVKINEKRIATMKKLNSLQDLSVALDALRLGKQNNSSEDLEAILVVIVPNDGNDTMPDSFEEIDHLKTIRCDSSDSDSSSEKKETSRSAWKSCKKAGVKVCRKACIEASKNTCAEYSCSKKMKKMFKKQCKSTCKSKFS